MKLLHLMVALAVSWDPATGLATPATSLVHRKKSILPHRSTHLAADASSAAAELPRGGESGGTASIPSEVFNLIKSIVGAGVLSLPAGKLLQTLLGSFVSFRS